MVGEPGHDKLYGGPGNDVFIAGHGHNLLVGGGGDNTFVFRSFHTDAHIDGFHHGDTLEFAKSVFKSLHHLHYDAATGALLFEPTGSGSSHPVQFATLAPHLHFTHADVLFV
jgi:Ca2+-binding RTX toxin-like protein